MSYTIEQEKSQRQEEFGEYKYLILRDGRIVAAYWHDYRGDDHELVFLDGTTELAPVGRMTDFAEGGGTLPFKLISMAIAFLDRHAK